MKSARSCQDTLHVIKTLLPGPRRGRCRRRPGGREAGESMLSRLHDLACRTIFSPRGCNSGRKWECRPRPVPALFRDRCATDPTLDPANVLKSLWNTSFPGEPHVPVPTSVPTLNSHFSSVFFFFFTRVERRRGGASTRDRVAALGPWGSLGNLRFPKRIKGLRAQPVVSPPERLRAPSRILGRHWGISSRSPPRRGGTGPLRITNA
jgi:hypothetical protein